MSDPSGKSYKSAGTTKAVMITKLLRRNKGASIAELMKATGWQAHSLRGFIAGSLKKSGYIIRSSQEEGRPRRYFLNEVQS